MSRVLFNILEVWRYVGYIILVLISAYMNYNLGFSLGYDLATKIGWGVFFLALDSGKIYTFIRGYALFRKKKSFVLLAVYLGLAALSIFATASWGLSTIQRQSSVLAKAEVEQSRVQSDLEILIDVRKRELESINRQIDSLLDRLDSQTRTGATQYTINQTNNNINRLREQQASIIRDISAMRSDISDRFSRMVEDSSKADSYRSDSAFILVSEAINGFLSPIQIMSWVIFYSALMLEFFTLVLAPRYEDDEEKGGRSFAGGVHQSFSVEESESHPVTFSDRLAHFKSDVNMVSVISAAVLRNARIPSGQYAVLSPKMVSSMLGYPTDVVRKIYTFLSSREGPYGNTFFVKYPGRRKYYSNYLAEDILSALGLSTKSGEDGDRASDVSGD